MTAMLANTEAGSQTLSYPKQVLSRPRCRSALLLIRRMRCRSGPAIAEDGLSDDDHLVVVDVASAVRCHESGKQRKGFRECFISHSQFGPTLTVAAAAYEIFPQFLISLMLCFPQFVQVALQSRIPSRCDTFAVCGIRLNCVQFSSAFRSNLVAATTPYHLLLSSHHRSSPSSGKTRFFPAAAEHRSRQVSVAPNY